jgi:hypothetical protein
VSMVMHHCFLFLRSAPHGRMPGSEGDEVIMDTCMASRGLRRTGAVRREPCLALPWAAESRVPGGLPETPLRTQHSVR